MKSEGNTDVVRLNSRSVSFFIVLYFIDHEVMRGQGKKEQKEGRKKEREKGRKKES